MTSSIPAQALITSPPVLRRQEEVDDTLLGYWLNNNSWERMECAGEGEAYFTSGSYAGCNEIHTSCTNGESQEASGKTLTCNMDASCISLTIHDNTPTPTLDLSAKTHLLCAGAWSDDAFTLFRATTAASTSTPSPSSSSESSLESSSGDPSSSPASQTTSTTSAPSTSPEPSDSGSSVNAGVIAGATIGGVALALIVGFLIWFFAFHRKKNKQNHSVIVAPGTTEYYANYGNQQPYGGNNWNGQNQNYGPGELQGSTPSYGAELPADYQGPHK